MYNVNNYESVLSLLVNSRVGYHSNFINSNYDSTYQLWFLSIPMWLKKWSQILFAKHVIAAGYHEQKSASYIKTGLN